MATTAAAAVRRYLFMLNAVDDGYGGLEHRASTALIAAAATCRAAAWTAQVPDGYLTLLGLISHEYFHTWNVKRLKPAELATVDWQRENHTGLLWFFEGFTSYYDELMLLRCGLIDAPRYLRLLAKTVNAVATTPGRQVQSVAAASFDAWVKYYRPDENTPNATVSYYLKGALVALCFDLTLRQQGRSLDVVLRGLWKRSGGGPITEADIAEVLAQVAGRRLDAELQAWVHGTGELPCWTSPRNWRRHWACAWTTAPACASRWCWTAAPPPPPAWPRATNGWASSRRRRHRAAPPAAGA
jgi:predicted metalloprotease with PDZ domain